MPAGGVLAVIGSVGTVLSISYTAWKYGNVFTRKKLFYKLAKVILTKIFGEVKNVAQIKELAYDLQEKFSKKTLKELKTFMLDLLDLEQKQKKYQFDKFFRDNKEDIIKNVENLKEYFIKRQIVEEFSLFIFARLYDAHIDISFYKELQAALIEDCVISIKVSPMELLEKLEEIYLITAQQDIDNFDALHARFVGNQRALLDVLETVKDGSTSMNKRRLMGFFKEQVEAMKFSTAMVGKEAYVDNSVASKRVQMALGSSALSSKSDSNNSKNSDFMSALNALKKDIGGKK